MRNIIFHKTEVSESKGKISTKNQIESTIQNTNIPKEYMEIKVMSADSISECNNASSQNARPI